MKTVFLPGFSLKNKDWAHSVAKDLGEEVVVHEWKHWETGNNDDFSVGGETKAVLELISHDSVNIIAKSVGTFVLTFVASKIAPQINKIILCGVPLNDLTETDKKLYIDFFKSYPSDRLIVFQNTLDSHGTYEQLVKFFKENNLEVKIVEKEREDHEYPYPEDFKNYFIE